MAQLGASHTGEYSTPADETRPVCTLCCSAMGSLASAKPAQSHSRLGRLGLAQLTAYDVSRVVLRRARPADVHARYMQPRSPARVPDKRTAADLNHFGAQPKHDSSQTCASGGCLGARLRNSVCARHTTCQHAPHNIRRPCCIRNQRWQELIHSLSPLGRIHSVVTYLISLTTRL
jgi:hypothetical protein